MVDYNVGIILTNNTENWVNVAPKSLIYNSNAIEIGIRKLINRQLIFKRFSEINGYKIIPVVIIIDNITFDNINFASFGIQNISQLYEYFENLLIHIIDSKTEKIPDHIFNAVWNWSTLVIGKRDICNLKRRKSESHGV